MDSLLELTRPTAPEHTLSSSEEQAKQLSKLALKYRGAARPCRHGRKSTDYTEQVSCARKSVEAANKPCVIQMEDSVLKERALDPCLVLILTGWLFEARAYAIAHVART